MRKAQRLAFDTPLIGNPNLEVGGNGIALRHESPGDWCRRVIVREVAEPLGSSATSGVWLQIRNGNGGYGVVKVASTPESVPSLLLAIRM